MSAFDPKAFLDMQFNEASSITRVPIPVGEYTAVVEKVDTRGWQGKKDPSQSGVALDVTYNIDDQKVKEQLKRQKVAITQGIMLDLTENGGLDFSEGRNVALGRLRSAAGVNEPGKPFSFRMLEGRVVKIVVGHSPSTSPNAQPGDVYEDVRAVVKA